MSSKSKCSKKSATILHAVPESPILHDKALEQQRGLDIGQSYQRYLRSHGKSATSPSKPSSPSLAEDIKGGPRSATPSSARPTTSRSNPGLKKARSTPLLKETIGSYKHGKIHWRKGTRCPSRSDTSSSQPFDRFHKPKIRVVIPSGRDRPLPALPFFDTPKGSSCHSTLNRREGNRVYDVSPPSATPNTIRNSIVSPLSQFHSHIHAKRVQHTASVGRKGSRGVASRSTKYHKRWSQSSSGSDYSHHSDASSIHSNRSSKTSVEIEDVPNRSKAVRRSVSESIVQSSIVGTIPVLFQTTVSAEAARNERIPPPASPPRRYASHPPIEQDESFKPTCEADCNRGTVKKLPRRPIIARKSSKRNIARRSRTLDASHGVIDKAIRRSASKEFSTLTPTLSQAVDDLEHTLISFTTEQPTAENEEPAQPTSPKEAEWLESPREMKDQTDATVGDEAKEHCPLDLGEFEPLDPPPEVPRKSSKRRSAAYYKSIATLPDSHIASQMSEARPRTRINGGLKLAIPEPKKTAKTFEPVPVEMPPPDLKRTITPGGAERVILGILQSLDSWDDLFAAAKVNRGFYRVYKRHELDLIKSTLYKMSPPAWEFREIAFPGHDLLYAEDLEMARPEEEYTPLTYMQLHKRDEAVVCKIKAQILEKCQSFLRPEITVALVTNGPEERARVDSALWRIWTFCKIFGSGKGREEDIVAQMDWLKGGDLAHEKTGSGIMTTDYMNGTLIGAPECFAQGNEGGLTAEQLFDMMELWNCLGVLLQGFAGKTPEARQAGVFEPTHVRGGDIDGEWAMLDEWCNYLLTFGLSTVLDLSVLLSPHDVKPAFDLAAQKGLVNWSPPVSGGSRRKFLSEATSRIYEDKIANKYARLSSREVQRQQSKMRIQRHISELRYRKNTGNHGPMITMNEERPMSEWDAVIANLTRQPPTQAAANNIVSYIPSLRSAHASELSIPLAELPNARTPSPIPRLVAEPLLPTPPPSTVPSNRYSIATSMPSIEEHPAHRRSNTIAARPTMADHPYFRHRVHQQYQPHHQHLHHRQSTHHSPSSIYSSSSPSPITPTHPVFAQHPAQRDIFSTGSHENTADKAIYRIVEMGFTPEEAKEALRLTDAGDGLRVDEAVEWLLRRQG
ncbi:hypothetical protein IAQ61_009036 [Plenodomus lingam]|uniref:UBA domain-containing protein n=1 Tax=Leptosphaeria maculans (strain JN3 / isolate v23.1.3 / race Av1-4-5-6-7-8) TaxID=985895 RepID=E4ZNV7_LEPMJ|nr:hypothetical protein LEMA_P042270.1 [Plenodomus lingam JN3]KAH9865090.1 hypothetical protein IAQ61_009036 [Plenodomus lingam]CBX93326.1 hypothetical protein LEMA_P042270.1 [Plenodomus lingam JN3]